VFLERRAPSALKRYAAGLLLGVAAVAAAFLLRPLVKGQTPLTPFTIAVILAAAYGGFGPGLATTAFCAGLIFGLLSGPLFSPLFGEPGLPFFIVSGVVISFVVELLRRDNAKVAEANRELSRRSEELAKSNEELERFAYALSHDLQTPLRTISMFTEKLAAKLAPGADPESETALRFVAEGVANMQAMIRGLLAYATASKGSPGASRADVNAVLKTVLQDLRMEIEECGATVTSEALPVVIADETQIRQVLQNLISNAIKYRSERRPQIHVSAKSGAAEWIFCVRDNGIGIDMKYADRIFGLFERLRKEPEGTGIGLAVSRAIVDRHGGRIWVESEPGTGSAFYFTLPKGTEARMRAGA
jgi:light-regulated signal transduction histidine kinase (bacteriophytochrome)